MNAVFPKRRCVFRRVVQRHEPKSRLQFFAYVDRESNAVLFPMSAESLPVPFGVFPKQFRRRVADPPDEREHAIVERRKILESLTHPSLIGHDVFLVRLAFAGIPDIARRSPQEFDLLRQFFPVFPDEGRNVHGASISYHPTMRAVLLAVVLALVPLPLSAQTPETSDTYDTATVLEVLSVEHDDSSGFVRTVQRLRVRLSDGTEATMENAVVGGMQQQLLRVGQTVVVERLERADGSVELLGREPYRVPWVFGLAGAFFLLAIFFAGRTGFTSIVGLLVSILILAFYVVPAIGNGGNPLVASLVGSVLIACTSLYLAHGFTKRTSVALLSTLVTLGLSLVLSIVAVNLAQLFGGGAEEAIFLQIGPLQAVNLRGLLLGGIVIGALGVLDDITTTQTAAIDELKRSNPRMSAAALYRSGLSIGREHIASLVNTLALAYAGASLPLLLLFWSDASAPWWVILNNESLVEEIVRTIVGSMTLTLAVPISTWFACRFLSGTGSPDSHAHVHAH